MKFLVFHIFGKLIFRYYQYGHHGHSTPDWKINHQKSGKNWILMKFSRFINNQMNFIMHLLIYQKTCNFLFRPLNFNSSHFFGCYLIDDMAYHFFGAIWYTIWHIIFWVLLDIWQGISFFGAIWYTICHIISLYNKKKKMG